MGAWFSRYMFEEVSKERNDSWLKETISIGGEFRALMAGIALGALFHEHKFGLAWERSNLMVPLQQRLNHPAIKPVMMALGMFADELIVPYFAALYWTLDKYKCIYGIWLVPVSEILNGCLKWYFRVPRPPWVDDRVQMMSWAQEYSFPSSHSQIIWALATFFTGSSIGKLRNRLHGSLGVTRWAYWYYLVAPIGFASLVSLSRVYEGVHYPRDISVGAGIGVVLASVYMRVLPSIDTYLQSLPIHIRVPLMQAAVPVGAAFVYQYYTHAARAHRADPMYAANVAQWRSTALRGRGSVAGDAGLTLDPMAVPLTNYVGMVGVLSGLGLGQALVGRTPLDPPETWTAATLRNVVGLVGLMSVFLGARAVEQQITNAFIKNTIRFTRHAWIPVWILNGAPVVFRKLKI